MLIQRPKPIVDQVVDILRGRIQDRVYPAGHRMPSESELAQELGVSRTTVRTVLAKFAAEGLILRKQGDGTYVNERIEEIDTPYGGVRDFSELIKGNGYTPSIETQSVERRLITPDEASELETSQENAVVAMSRLFFADGQPVIHATNILPASLIKVPLDELEANTPIHQILRTYCYEQVGYVVSDIEATLVPSTLQSKLACAENTPLLLIKEIFYNKDHKPLILGLSYYNFSILKLRLVHTWHT